MELRERLAANQREAPAQKRQDAFAELKDRIHLAVISDLGPRLYNQGMDDSQLHQGVNEIREIRTQIDSLHKRFGEEERLKTALAAADDLNRKMSEVEQQLVQVNMKGSEGNLAFPNMLNESFDAFSHVIENADNAPTVPQIEAYKTLNDRLTEQLNKWAQIKKDEVPKVAAAIKQLDLPALSVKEKPESPK